MFHIRAPMNRYAHTGLSEKLAPAEPNLHWNHKILIEKIDDTRACFKNHSKWIRLLSGR